ncbi:MAG: hypothetical protein GX804_11120 [Lentisphaerae bacterium]|jgi:hypothetical protein|nr:hypothetical protein [Lentisphaerota bacterium]
MKDKQIRRLLLENVQKQKLTPADEFWADFRTRVEQMSAEETSAEAAGMWQSPHPATAKWRSILSSFTVKRFGIASLAAAVIVVCATLVMTLPQSAADEPVFNNLEFGSDLKHNGVLVITDKDTNARILWVITEDL